MVPNLQRDINKQIGQCLQALGRSVAVNFTALDKSFGPDPLKWMKQLGADLGHAQAEYDQLLSTAVETLTSPDMSKTTQALERILTTAFCLQIVTRAASPKVMVVEH